VEAGYGGAVTTAPELDDPTVAAELADLLRDHQGAWLAELLPAGPCLLWDGDPHLARTLASDGRRTVALVALDERARELAVRSSSPGVQVRTPSSVRVDGGFAALVALLDGVDDTVAPVLEPLLPLLAEGAVVALITRPDLAEEARQHLVADGRHTTVVPQVLSLASTLGAEGRPTVELPRHEPCTTIVLAGANAEGSA
jgi:hypothetical protein